MSSREFNQQVSKAKDAAATGPVFITDRGRPAHVLLSYSDYLQLSQQTASIAQLLHLEGAAEATLSTERAEEEARAADFS